MYVVQHFTFPFLHSHAFLHSGGLVVHSYGRLIPHEFPITNLQQISGPDGVGRITCTVSSGEARFFRPGEELETDGVTQTGDGVTATLVVNPSDNFENRDIFCNAITSYFYLFISDASEFIAMIEYFLIEITTWMLCISELYIINMYIALAARTQDELCDMHTYVCVCMYGRDTFSSLVW